MMFCMDLQLQFFGTPVLRQRADEVERPTPELHALAEQMLEVMYAERGVGLAAEQVGRTERLFVIDIPPSSDIDERGERENPEVSMLWCALIRSLKAIRKRPSGAQKDV